MPRSRMIGTGGYVPTRIVTNEELARLTGVAPAAIFRRTGIRERRWAAPDEATSDLALRAAKAALDAAGTQAAALDAIILSTTSPDTPMPSAACHVQRMLGAKRAFAFDLAASCSGFLYALSVGDLMIRLGQANRVLVAAAEVKSRYLNFKDGSTAILFGDGAGAAVLAAGDERHGVLSVTLHADGSRADLITIPAGGSRLPASEKTVAEGLHAIHMKGPSLFRVAVRRLETAVTETLKAHGLAVRDVTCFIFHQANGRLLDKVVERLGIPAERTFSMIERYGNTSSSSLPVTLDAAVRAGKVKPGDLVLLGTIGGGLTWGTALIRW
ncbi:MAG: beta-ketoacyl-ACP synthase III [Nitrospiraceae bacterium]|nr:MAG: beta-ketoacyl-ACP synthase III [Nitrospiraceae bacterium]